MYLALHDQKQQEQLEALEVLAIGSPSHHCTFILTSSEGKGNLSNSASDICEPTAEELSSFFEPEPKVEDDKEDEHVAATPPPPNIGIGVACRGQGHHGTTRVMPGQVIDALVC